MNEYETVERIFLLFVLLSNEEGHTRREIFEQVTLYSSTNARRAADRMFERDIAFLERMGFTIERQRKGRTETLYRMNHPEDLFRSKRE